jgi:hypothetical protein
VRAVEDFRRSGRWPSYPEEGVDAWNARQVAAHAGEPARETLARYDAARIDGRRAVADLTTDQLRSPEGWSWTYDCLHGHVREHLAMVGRWCASADWPEAT